MDKQMVTGYNPQADAKKTGSEDLQKEGQEVKSQAPLLLKLNQIRENTPQSVKDRIDKKSDSLFQFMDKMKSVIDAKDQARNKMRKQGFAMARLVSLLILLSSCSYNLSPTTAQREQKKFERFKISPKEALIYSGTAFASYGLGKHFANIKLKD